MLHPHMIRAVNTALETGTDVTASAPIADVMRHAAHCHDCWAGCVWLLATDTHRTARAAAALSDRHDTAILGTAAHTVEHRWVLPPNQRLYTSTLRALVPFTHGHRRTLTQPFAFSICELAGWRRSLDDLEASTALLFTIRLAAETARIAGDAAAHAANQITADAATRR